MGKIFLKDIHPACDAELGPGFTFSVLTSVFCTVPPALRAFLAACCALSSFCLARFLSNSSSRYLQVETLSTGSQVLYSLKMKNYSLKICIFFFLKKKRKEKGSEECKRKKIILTARSRPISIDIRSISSSDLIV